MTQKFATIVATLWLLSACGRRTSDRETVDTVMVFQAAPPSTSQSAGSDSSKRTVLGALSAYSRKMVSADSAARVVVDYLEANHSLNAALDPELVDAIKREQRRRHGH